MSTHTVQAAVASRKITPPLGTPMGGFGFRDHGCEGVRDDLYVRVLHIAHANERRLLIVALDVVVVDLETVAAYKAEIQKRWGLAPHEVLISVTHTHSGPLLVERFYAKTPRDPNYMALLQSRIMEAVAEAQALEDGCTLAFGRSEIHLGVNRRLPDGSGGVKFMPYAEGYVERDLPVLAVRDRHGAPLCVLFCAAVHPSILGDYFISGEFPAVAGRYIEHALGGRVMALYLQGAAGEIKVNVSARTRPPAWGKGAYSSVKRAGELLGAAVVQLVAEGLEPLHPEVLTVLDSADLPVALPEGDLDGYYAAFLRPDMPFARGWAEYHRDRVRRGESIPRTVPCPVQLIHLGPGADLVVMAGELTSGLARAIRDGLGGADPIFLGYGNGILSYLPSEAMLPEGGYEAYRSVFLGKSLPAPYAPGIEAALIATVRRLLQQAEPNAAASA